MAPTVPHRTDHIVGVAGAGRATPRAELNAPLAPLGESVADPVKNWSSWSLAFLAFLSGQLSGNIRLSLLPSTFVPSLSLIQSTWPRSNHIPQSLGTSLSSMHTL